MPDTTIVLNPNIFLPWMMRNLENSGVKFKRLDLSSLSDARHLGHDVLVNATGLGPRDLADVQDKDMLFLKGQIMLVKSDYKKTMMRDDGETYTYVIPRLDGTVILGGIRDPDIRYDESWTCSLAGLTVAVKTAIQRSILRLTRM